MRGRRERVRERERRERRKREREEKEKRERRKKEGERGRERRERERRERERERIEREKREKEERENKEREREERKLPSELVVLPNWFKRVYVKILLYSLVLVLRSNQSLYSLMSLHCMTLRQIELYLLSVIWDIVSLALGPHRKGVTD